MRPIVTLVAIAVVLGGCSDADGDAQLVVSSVLVEPTAITLAPGATQQFTARATYSDGSVGAVSVTWTATGGSITREGLFTAGSSAGDFAVVATAVGDVQGTATVRISELPPANTVSVLNNTFVPLTLTVSRGTPVTFIWPAGSTNHNVTPWSGNAVGIPASPSQPALLDGPTNFQVTFGVPGVYRYYCSAHGSVSQAGQPSGMAGAILVE